MPAKGHKHAPEALGPGGSISRGTKYGAAKRKWLEQRVRELEAALYAVSPRDLALLLSSGAVPESVRPYADVAAAEVLRLRRSAEGEPGTTGYRPLSEGQAAALRVAERHLLLGLCEQARALQKDDGESATRAGTQFTKFLAVVKDAIGLGPRELEVPDLSTYLEQKAREVAPETTISNDPDGSAADAEQAASTASEGGASASRSQGAVLKPSPEPQDTEGK